MSATLDVPPPSENAKALLLLTAPLIVGRGAGSRDLLAPMEYQALARALHDLGKQPSDLLGPGSSDLIARARGSLDAARLERLLGRGFLLGQALEGWQTRAIWVVCRADPGYPKRLRARLRERAPAVLYGCGDVSLPEGGGLAVVGSRNATPRVIEETEAIGRAAAEAGRAVVSGGARGVDQAAMRGVLGAGGRAVGVLADGLARAVLAREHREVLSDGRLVLLTPSDPSAPFHVGNAMQRNKLIYALADAALVMAAEKPGGTWAGAEEQLRRLKLVPVFTRSTGEVGPVLRELQSIGAKPWPNPAGPRNWQELFATFAAQAPQPDAVREPMLFEVPAGSPPPPIAPADELFGKFRDLIVRVDVPRKAAEIARDLGLTLPQTNAWLRRLVAEGAVEKLQKPVRYRVVRTEPSLFVTSTRAS